ncbi:MAG: hypothetical protein RL577_983 [Bacteroidota bacterium]|jgi:hypothetical protein
MNWNRIVRILLIAAALYVGGAVNMGIITLSPELIPPPEGADLTTEEGLLKAAPLMQPKHFLLPWLAHALGTFVAAFLAAILAPSIRHYSFWIPGGLFFIGGLMMVFMIPAPFWFIVADLGLAYFPMAFLGHKLSFWIKPA